MKPLLSKEELADLLSPLGSETETETDTTTVRSKPSAAKQVKAKATVRQQAGKENTFQRSSPLLQVRVEAGQRQLSPGELLQLKKGSLLILDKYSHEPLELYINDQLIGRGEPVLIGNKVGIKLSEISVPKDLLK